MNSIFFLVREIWSGKSVTRAFLNRRLSAENLSGVTVDIGGGNKDMKFLRSIKNAEIVSFSNLDTKAGHHIDFETDRLPYDDRSQDNVLCFNVLEHIYNYKHLITELFRIKNDNGRIVGFVPFLMWYHPDHSDYFRYTHEALEKIFTECGASKIIIEPIHYGPFMAATHMVLLSFPRILRPLFFLSNYMLDAIYVWLRPSAAERYVLGYYFILK